MRELNTKHQYLKMKHSVTKYILQKFININHKIVYIIKALYTLLHCTYNKSDIIYK